MKVSPEPGGAAITHEFGAQLSSLQQDLEREIAAWLTRKRRDAASYPPEAIELIDSLAELVTAGGKRLRPALVYYGYRACGGRNDEHVLSLALAVEFLHSFLLIHDDIMDHAEVRRGRPTSHASFRDLHSSGGWHGVSRDYGHASAILVGDLAYSYSVEAFSRILPHTPHAAELQRVFFSMCEEVITGQHLEMRVAARRTAEEADLHQTLRLKSGCYSVERPLQLGAVLAGADEKRLEVLSRYGSAVGEAFQLQDDLLGMFGDSKTVGKPVGADLIEGKYTLLIFHTLRMAEDDDRRVVEESLGQANLEDDRADLVCEIIRRCGALAHVREMIAERLRYAGEALTDHEWEPDGQAFLEGLIDYLWERKR
jgi:geranylgeranyl diphosphate synthase type I